MTGLEGAGFALAIPGIIDVTVVVAKSSIKRSKFSGDSMRF
jgi:hypothetical protein